MVCNISTYCAYSCSACVLSHLRWSLSARRHYCMNSRSIFSQSCLFCFYYCSIPLVDRVLVHPSARGLHWPLHKVVQLTHTSSAVHSSEYQVYNDTHFLKWSAQDTFHHVAVICYRLSTNHCLVFHWNDSTCALGVWFATCPNSCSRLCMYVHADQSVLGGWHGPLRIRALYSVI